MKKSIENAANAASIENKNVAKVRFPELIEVLRDVELEEFDYGVAAFIYYHYMEKFASTFGVYFEDEAVSSLYCTPVNFEDCFLVSCDSGDAPIKSVLVSEMGAFQEITNICLEYVSQDYKVAESVYIPLSDFLESETDVKKPLFGIFEKYLAEYWDMKSVHLTIEFEFIKIEVERD